jgi:hypothetical protein
MKPYTRLLWGLLIANVLTAAQATPGVGASKQLPLDRLPVRGHVTVPIGPGWLESGFGSLWVTKIDSRLLIRIDPTTNRVIKSIPAGLDPEA